MTPTLCGREAFQISGVTGTPDEGSGKPPVPFPGRNENEDMSERQERIQQGRSSHDSLMQMIVETADMQIHKREQALVHKIPSGTMLTRVKNGLVNYVIEGSFTVDGVIYDRKNSASPYFQAMLSIKSTEACYSGRQVMNASAWSLEHNRRTPEWSDLEWDPTIRL